MRKVFAKQKIYIVVFFFCLMTLKPVEGTPFQIHYMLKGVNIGMSLTEFKKKNTKSKRKSPRLYSETLNFGDLKKVNYWFSANPPVLERVVLHYANGTWVGRRLYKKYGQKTFKDGYVFNSEANHFGIYVRANFNKAEYSSTLLAENREAHNFWLKNRKKKISSKTTSQAGVCLNTEGKKLANLINNYRKTKRLPAIAISKKLSKVAQLHVEDLLANRPDRSSHCNTHSWSNKTKGSACCYTRDHRQAKCMWSKPKELANYHSYGFEIAFGPYTRINALNSLRAWQKSPGHNDVMVNQGVWRRYKWNAMGVGINKEYAVVWFGTLRDAEVCKP